MLEIRLTIEAGELASAINNLASALGNAKATVATATTTPVAPQQPMQVQPQQPMAAPVMPAPMPTAQTAAPFPAPVSEPAPSPAPMPTAQPQQYTVEQIMQAGATLMDAGKVNELMALLAQFGVQAVMDLKPEQMGPFATAMRELGAKI